MKVVSLEDAMNQFHAQLNPDIADASQEELHRWAEQVQESFNELHDLLLRQRGRVHDRLFRKAGALGADEQQTIDELKRADKTIEELLAIVKSQIIVLAVESASDAPPRLDQNDLEPEIVLEFIDRGTELVDWIREQESTISTWYRETFQPNA